MVLTPPHGAHTSHGAHTYHGTHGLICCEHEAAFQQGLRESLVYLVLLTTPTACLCCIFPKQHPWRETRGMVVGVLSGHFSVLGSYGLTGVRSW